MHLTPIQNQAIARLALIVGSATFDRLFAGVRFEEVDSEIQTEALGAPAFTAMPTPELPTSRSFRTPSCRPDDLVRLRSEPLRGGHPGWGHELTRSDVHA